MVVVVCALSSYLNLGRAFWLPTITNITFFRLKLFPFLNISHHMIAILFCFPDISYDTLKTLSPHVGLLE